MRSDGAKKRASRKGVSTDRQTQAEPREAAAGGFRPTHLFVILTMIAAGGGVVATAGAAPVNAVFVSMAIGSVGLAAYVLYRAVWPLVAPASDEEPEVADRRMRVTLKGERATARRAINDLEFDRDMGKVSEADFQEMRARLDGGRSGYRDMIERDLAARSASAPGQVLVAEAASGGVAGLDDRTRPRACGNCGTSNDPDAKFCKKCGSRLSE